MTPNEYIEKLYEKQGHKVVCSSVELDLSYSATEGKDLEGTFQLINCKEPESLLELDGFVFGNYYRESTTNIVDFFFFLKSSDAAQGLLQSFAAQFSKGA